MIHRVVIGIGANIDPKKNIQSALQLLGSVHKLVAFSEMVQTAPLGFSDQPDFLNGAALIETEMDKSTLNNWLKSVEKQLGRVRTANKCGPRPIDLDIVVWDDVIVDPHVQERPFLKNAVQELLPALLESQN